MNQNRIIQIPRIFDPRGSLSVVEELLNIPFIIKEVSWLYDFNNQEDFTYKTPIGTNHLIVALHGSIHIYTIKDNEKGDYLLHCPYEGLLITEGSHYRFEATPETVCLCITG